MKKLFTSESVTEGHPDKLCDYIADSILDEYLKKDPLSRVACEVVAGKNIIFITGEITSIANIDIERVIRKAIKEVGYVNRNSFNYVDVKIIINLSKQSEDIALGTNDLVNGAGDQGIMFGYASNETKEYMPLGIILAQKLAKRLADVRKNKIIDYLLPDGKTEVTIEYENNIPKRVDTVVVSCQHLENVSIDIIKNDIINLVIRKVIPSKYLDENTKYYINPTGRFVIGGPDGDSGLTGRKIIADTYGGYAHHGGGAFSGKDSSKVDRCAAYMARYIAKNIVANNLANQCEIELGYVIGKPDPISININTFNTNKISEEEILEIINNNFDLSVKGIISLLELRKPIYRKTTNYGHFGKEKLPWEKIITLKN